LNIPWSLFHRDPAKPELGFQPREKVRELLAPALAKKSENKQLITSCGSGVSACVINFALAELGVENVMLYDGSWAEYGNIPTAKVETGSHEQ
jgi:thiosulfate/3-mercaptopyruvate sulfurtransferase